MLKGAERVIGRGIILICDDEDFKCGDKITLEVKGVERVMGNRLVGLVVGNNIEK